MSLRPKVIDFDRTWRSLKESFTQIINCNRFERSSWNDSFSDVYNLCVAYPESYAEQLYESIHTFVKDHVTSIYEELGVKTDEEVLKAYYETWEVFFRGQSYLNQLCRYLNQHYVKKSDKNNQTCLSTISKFMDMSDSMMSVGELALDTWKELVVVPLMDKLRSQMLLWIRKDRKGGQVNVTVLQGSITSLVQVDQWRPKNELELYKTFFETPFLGESEEFYLLTAQLFLEECDCSLYMKKVLQFLEDERRRALRFLNSASFNVREICAQKKLVNDQLGFLHSEAADFIKSERKADLTNMYELLRPVDGGVELLINELEKHIAAEALERLIAIEDNLTPMNFVETLLEIHNKYRAFIELVFKKDGAFYAALDKAMQRAINREKGAKFKAPELVAKYVDLLLRKSSKGYSESEVFDKLTASIIIFKYLDDKDVYQRFYAKSLARRLINSLSHSMDMEESMIDKLKQTCGYEFTNKLHRMFTDMKVNEGTNASFSDDVTEKAHDLGGCGFWINVLQAGAWPISQSNLPTFAVPVELEKSLAVFEGFYTKKYSGRKLTWMFNLSTADVRVNYLPKPYAVNMGVFQMACLLPFNKARDSLTVAELRQNTQLGGVDLLKNLQTLVDAKLLLYQGAVEENSTLKLNMGFSNKRTKFKIALTTTKEAPKEVEQHHRTVEEDRKLYIQAAIVRTMKARKLLKHNLLIQEVISQARQRFIPNVAMIKKSIEILIDKAYLERDTQNSDQYRYLA